MKFLLITISKFLSPIVTRLPRRDANTVLMLGAASAVAFLLLALVNDNYPSPVATIKTRRLRRG